MTGLRVLLHADRLEARARVLRALDGSAFVDRVETATDADLLAEGIESGRFDAIFVELGDRGEQLLATLEQAGEPRPPLLLAGSGTDPELLVRAMRLRPEAFAVDDGDHCQTCHVPQDNES